MSLLMLASLSYIEEDLKKINIHRILLSLYRKIQTFKKIYERFAEEKTLLDFLSTSAVFQSSLILKIF